MKTIKLLESLNATEQKNVLRTFGIIFVCSMKIVHPKRRFESPAATDRPTPTLRRRISSFQN